MRLACDVCVGLLMELELWRAGYRIPVRAAAGEPDHAWLERGRLAGCDAVITADRGAADGANQRGMYSIYIPRGVGGDAMMQLILDGMEELEAIRGTPRPLAILTPLLATVAAILLAACAPRPNGIEPAPSPTPFCVRATVLIGKNAQAAMACFQTETSCHRAQRKVAGVGGLLGIREIGTCARAP